MSSLASDNTPGKSSDKENHNSQAVSTLNSQEPGNSIDYTKFLNIQYPNPEGRSTPSSDQSSPTKESSSDFPSKEDQLVNGILDEIQQNCKTEGVAIDPKFWGIIVPVIYSRRETFYSSDKRTGNFDILQDTIARLSDDNVLLKKNLAKKTSEADGYKTKTGELIYRASHLQSEIERLNTLLLDRMSEIIALKEQVDEKTKLIADLEKEKAALSKPETKPEAEKEEIPSLLRLSSGNQSFQPVPETPKVDPKEVEEQKFLQDQVIRSLKTELKQKTNTLGDKNKEISNLRDILNQNGMTIRELKKENEELQEKIKRIEVQEAMKSTIPQQEVCKDHETRIEAYHQLLEVLAEQKQKELQLIRSAMGDKISQAKESELFVTPKADKKENFKTPDSSTTDQTHQQEIESLRMRVKELEDQNQNYDEVCKKYEEVKRNCDLLAIVNQQLSAMNTDYSNEKFSGPPSPVEIKKPPQQKKEILTYRESSVKETLRTEENASPRMRDKSGSPLSDRSLQSTTSIGAKKPKAKKIDLERMSLANQKGNKKRNWGEDRRIFSENFAGKFDIVFCVDCTDSMGPYLIQLRNACRLIEKAILQDFDFIDPDIAFGFVGYRDHPPHNGNTWVTKIQDLTDIETCTKFITAMTAKSGPKNDPPEAVLSGIYDSIDRISWRENKNEKVFRMIIHIGDAPPHGRLFNNGKNDYYPNGDPSGINIQQISSRLILMDIYYRLIKIGHQVDIMEKEFSRNIADMYSVDLDKTEELDELVPGLVSAQLKLLNSSYSIKDKIFLNRQPVQGVKRTQKMGECYCTGLIFDEYIEFVDHEISEIPFITHLTFFYSPTEILGIQTEYDVNGEKASAKAKIACIGPAKEKVINFDEKEGVEQVIGYFKENGGLCGLSILTNKNRLAEVGCKSNKKIANTFKPNTKLVSIGGSLRNTSIDSLYFYYVTTN